ncbi:hypothetical protein RFI_17391 [Reticulomyxa filosa]|uniref:Uncharacterized protein n=1 Tax=Reticulomyxa filosa TaxID=46433 RepID=X6N0N7_RETFI|nr:hypothetical protein RFI_17391 [Reticulomyxa filosa]|eukprot:ETO19835.1 hypothetical protein RFI_17391 [Reticulomyxa filosa]
MKTRRLGSVDSMEEENERENPQGVENNNAEKKRKGSTGGEPREYHGRNEPFLANNESLHQNGDSDVGEGNTLNEANVSVVVPKPSDSKSDREWIHMLSKTFEKCHKQGKLDDTMFNKKVVRLEQMHLWHHVLSHSGNAYSNIKEIKLRWCALQSNGIKLLMDGLYQCTIHQNLEVLDLMERKK